MTRTRLHAPSLFFYRGSSITCTEAGHVVCTYIFLQKDRHRDLASNEDHQILSVSCVFCKSWLTAKSEKNDRFKRDAVGSSRQHGQHARGTQASPTRIPQHGIFLVRRDAEFDRAGPARRETPLDKCSALFVGALGDRDRLGAIS